MILGCTQSPEGILQISARITCFRDSFFNKVLGYALVTLRQALAQTIFWKFLKICEKIYLNIFMNIKNSWPIVIKSFTFSKRETTCRLSKQKHSTGVIVVCKKSVRSNFTNFTGKRLCQSLFFNKETLAQVFPVNFVKFLKIPFL